MYTIPPYLMRTPVTVEKYLGESGYGKTVYDKPQETKCWVDEKRGLVKNERGENVVSRAKLYMYPDVDIVAESKVTYNGKSATVIDVVEAKHLTGVSHLEVTLR